MSENIKILIVDDDPEVLFITSKLVGSYGYEVLTASTGRECMAIVDRQRPDLVLMDVVMPDADGPELCRKIKADPDTKNTYIVLISGMRTASDEQADGLNVGADGYIAKPISNRELKARVQAMVRILTAERERDRLIEELQEALAKVKKLSGLLPICAHCKKVRDDKGYWKQIEAYIQEHSEAAFSHSICRECAKEHYPDIAIYGEDA